MGSDLQEYLNQSAEVIRLTASHKTAEAMEMAINLCVNSLRERKTILVCGNGGSAADAGHIAGELVGRFLKDRTAWPCISLSDSNSIITAWANDMNFETVFSRQVEAHGSKGGVLIAISTSGNSINVVKAAEKAREIGMSVIGLTGEGGGKIAPLCDVLLDVPSKSTPLIQQAHMCLYHYLCARIEERMLQ